MSFRWFGSAIKKAELIATVQLRLRLSLPQSPIRMALTKIKHIDWRHRHTRDALVLLGSVSSLKDVLGPYRRAEDLSRFEEGLRQAGLPE